MQAGGKDRPRFEGVDAQETGGGTWRGFVMQHTTEGVIDLVLPEVKG